MGGSGGTEWGASLPGIDADEVDRADGEDVLEVGLAQSDVAAVAHSAADDALGEGGLDTGPGPSPVKVGVRLSITRGV